MVTIFTDSWFLWFIILKIDRYGTLMMIYEQSSSFQAPAWVINSLPFLGWSVEGRYTFFA